MSEPFSRPINAATRFCAVYGCPVRHSASPAMQNAGIAELGLDWRYLAFEVRPENLRSALEGAKAMRFVGVNLTVPHKLLAVEMVNELHESARTWGAVNTVLFEGKDPESGAWRPLIEYLDTPPEVRSHGFNTDADGITKSLQEDLKLTIAGASILLLGAGGAGRTAALKLASERAGSLYLVNRTAAKAEAVAQEIVAKYPGVRVFVGYPSQSVDLLLNATSLGLRQIDPSPLDESTFSLKQCRCVYDMIYRPAETRLLKKAKEIGCKTANGISMLLYQGARALEIWSGKEAPVATMRRALEHNVYG